MVKKDEAIKVTVGIMSYNNAEFIVEAIDSVIKQTYKNWELFIVDDCSKDNTYELVKPYLKDSNVNFVKHEVNKGQAKTWNTVLNFGNGEIIGTLHADDSWSNNMLENVVNSFRENPELDLVHTNWSFIGSTKKGPVENRLGSGIDVLKDEIEKFTILPSASFLSRRVIKKAPSPICDYRAAVDTYYFYRILIHANKVRSLGNALTNYRIHDNNETAISRSQGYVFEECIDNLRKLKKDYKLHHLSGLINRQIAEIFLILGVERIKFGDSKNTWNYLGNAVNSSFMGCLTNRHLYRLLFYQFKS
ncbi:glycosyltransferase family 2 protein [Neotamlana nanhaiensis]|uniref:glycosyltransferase family 2 protein n=1 Tax=Neotamlana nanhaiensis TaxID=1382798 RepID=UPI00069C3783|nr:glycosyltransferase family 2 protein [Tamlana nanhaiensis]